MSAGTEELRVNLPPTLSESQARLLLAVKSYEEGRVSLGRAAEMAGLSTRRFSEALARYHVPIDVDYLPEELRQETPR